MEHDLQPKATLQGVCTPEMEALHVLGVFCGHSASWPLPVRFLLPGEHFPYTFAPLP